MTQTGSDSWAHLVDTFRAQARGCANLGSPMYAALLDRIATDVEDGGSSREVLVGHEDDPGPTALALRLAGAVHRLVLERRAGALATFYPSVGGTWDLAAAWPAFERVLRDHRAELAAGLERPPQTNEVGRAAALTGGLLRMAEAEPFRRPVRLLEIGSSAGLNLLADRYSYSAEGGPVQGPEDSPLHLPGAWRGAALTPWPGLEVVERLGCDPAPVDPTTTEGRLTLTSYVWPDQTARLERLRSALAVAARHPATVLRQDARSFVDAVTLVEGTVTVLWHSVVWQYLSRDEQDAVSARIAALGAAATARSPFAHLVLEPTRRAPDRPHEFLVVLERWPGGERTVLGEAPGHGIPVTWE